MIRYTTVAKEACAEHIVERSRFIAHVARACSREEAESFIASLKERFRDATHNVPAFIVGEKGELKRTSDDGEPQGTAGPPVLRMLEKEGLTNVVCVVSRYFGGIKLGTGGLVRAYTDSAKLALEAAGRHEVRDSVVMRLRIPYDVLSGLQHAQSKSPFEISDISYAEAVSLTAAFEPEYGKEFAELVGELSGGRAEVMWESEELR